MVAVDIALFLVSPKILILEHKENLGMGNRVPG